jgi:putative nucleotidyltransferase with HDIG domain
MSGTPSDAVVIVPSALIAQLRVSGSLPALQPVVLASLRLLQRSDYHGADVARLLSHDQALTARVLRLVNSAFYAPKERIMNPQHAVVLLGQSTLRALILKASILSGEDDRLGQGFWLHALGTAATARSLAHHFGIDAEDAFIAGLLHDVGKLALVRADPQNFDLVKGKVTASNCLWNEIEKTVFGTTHGAIGAELLSTWSFPAQLVAAVGCHHEPSHAPKEHATFAALVHLADILARALLIGDPMDSSIPAIDAIALERGHLTSTDFPRLLADAEEELGRSEIFFNILEGRSR